MTNNITSIEGPVVSPNENCYYRSPGEKVRLLERSSAFRGKSWGKINAEIGGASATKLELAFAFGLLEKYLKWFLNPEENPIVGFIVRALAGSADFLEGKRDQEMFGIYGHGVPELSGKSSEETSSEKAMLSNFNKKEDAYVDDYMQNKRQDDRLVSKSGEWATWAAGLKPIPHFISGILGNSWRVGIQTVLDLPARCYWRVRFFGKSLHSDFVTTIWDLTRFKFLSLFGSSDASTKFKNEAKKVGEMSDKYFQSTDLKYKSEANAGLGLYVKMLIDRMKEHGKSIRDPKAALKRKCDAGLLKEVKDKNDPNKNFEKGYVDLNSKDDQKEQRRLGLVDFTGPICAALGLLGTVAFDPLKIIWGACGFETGKNLICALSASRKSFSLIHYIPRFLMTEMHEGESYKKLDEKYMNSGKEPNEAISELRYARKSRYNNAILGMVMAAGNICEPILHLKRGIIGDSRFGNFLVDTIIRFNDSFFRFFSARRGAQGREEYLKAALQEKRGKEFINDAEFVDALSKLENTDFDSLMKGRVLESQEQDPGIIGSGVKWLAKNLDRVKKACTGEDAYRQAA